MKGRNRKIKERRHLYTIYRKSLCGVCHPKKKKPEKKNHISVSIKLNIVVIKKFHSKHQKIFPSLKIQKSAQHSLMR